MGNRKLVQEKGELRRMESCWYSTAKKRQKVENRK